MPPRDLRTRGQAIWAAYAADTLDAPSRALVQEAARCADTLDKLDALLAGRRDAWVKLVFDEMGNVELSVDKVLNERRMYQLAFMQQMNAIRAAGIKVVAAPAVQGQPQGRGGLIDELKRKRDQRESEPAR